jgi:hypothetical protein
VSTDILAYICLAGACTRVELPRAPVLFGLLIGLYDQAPAMFPVRGRSPLLNQAACEDFAECMAFGESYVTRSELEAVLAEHTRLNGSADAQKAFAALLENKGAFVLAFGFM